MSQLDSELNTLRMKLAVLEEQKRIEAETALEKRKFPLKTLEDAIDNFRQSSNRGCGKIGSGQRESYLNSRRELSFLEPILIALKDIQERLEILDYRLDSLELKNS
jgi:hypothetical protein